MNFGVDNIITKVMADDNAPAEMAKAVMDILRSVARIEAMYANPVVKEKVAELVPEEPKVKVRRKHREYTINGKTKTINEWCAEYGVNRSTLEKRIYGDNMPLEEALKKGTSKKLNKVAVIEYDRFGKQIRQFDSVSRTARELQIPVYRINRALGMTPADQINEYGFYLMTA